MPNVLSAIAPALKVLGEGMQVLPASGAAVEYLQRPDQDEIEDALVHSGQERITAFHEEPTPTLANLYRATPPTARRDDHLFRFFIDGSLKTYFLATAVEGRRSFPIELAQIGAAVIERADDGKVRVAASKHRILLLVPKVGGRGMSSTMWSQLERLSDPDGGFEIKDFDVPDIFNSDATADPRNKAGAKARFRMHELEIEQIESTTDRRSDDSWLILDGAVKLDRFIRAPYLIGVAKSFRKDPEFHFGQGRAVERKDITSILAGLPHAHRTAAFSSHDGQVAFWYLRLREQREVDYPLMGVVKVELPRPDRTPVRSELADRLSSCLVAERNVTPYGSDVRWHCHLYPIYMAEQAIKNGFYSQEVLMGALKWPVPQRA